MKILVILALTITYAYSAVPDPEPYKVFLIHWHGAWNSDNPEAICNLIGPNANIGDYQSLSVEKKKEFQNQFTSFRTEFGKITNAELGVYIERKDRYVVKITYANKGLVPGTMIIEQLDDGSWKLKYFNVDGQGEPELNM